MAEWKDYASVRWKSDGTVWSAVTSTFNPMIGAPENSRTQVSSGSTNQPETGTVYWTYDSANTSGTQGWVCIY